MVGSGGKLNFRGITTINRDVSLERKFLAGYPAPKLDILIVILFLSVSFTTRTVAQSEVACVALVKGPIAFDVTSCTTFDPVKYFDPTKDKFKFIGGLDPAGRQQLLDSYRGLVVKGTVVLSRAFKDGVSQTKGALQDEKTFFFIPPGQATCAAIANKRVTGNVAERCCNGNGDAPCLLGTGMVLNNPQVSGDATVGIKPSATASKPRSKDYLEAEKFYGMRKFNEAIKSYLKAQDAGDMDIKGLYRLGNSYREIDKCGDAISPLKKIWDRKQSNKVWTEEEPDARKGIFLLARCHAKIGDPSGAVFYLNSYLLNPRKFRSELQQSIRHKDFGWIHTSKEYIEYKSAAEKKLNGAN